MPRTKAVLIIGGSGFVGSYLAEKLRENYKVFATYRSRRIEIPGVTFIPMGVDNRNWVKRVVYTAQPDVVIYAAGNSDVDWAEANPREAELIHTGGAGTVSGTADIFQPKFIYLSNPYTFDGLKGNYREPDTVLPSTQLGKAKIGGENFIRGKALNYIILRSSPCFGRSNARNLSFFDRLRMKLERGEKTEMTVNEIHSFAAIDGLIEAIQRLMESGIRNKVVHYGGLTKLSYYDFGREFAKRFGYDPSLIHPRKTFHKSAVSSPDHVYDFSLNSSFLAESLKIKPLLLEESFDLVEKLLIPRARSA